MDYYQGARVHAGGLIYPSPEGPDRVLPFEITARGHQRGFVVLVVDLSRPEELSRRVGRLVRESVKAFQTNSPTP